MKQKLVEKFGGAPDDHEGQVTALWMMTDGAAMLLIAKTILPQDVAAARAVFAQAIATLRQRQSG